MAEDFSTNGLLRQILEASGQQETVPTDLAQLVTSIGQPSDAAWNMTDPNATLISVAKAIALNTQAAP